MTQSLTLVPQTVAYQDWCTDCVNMNHGFGNEVIRRHSCESFGVCDDCKEAKQVATFRVWQDTSE